MTWLCKCHGCVTKESKLLWRGNDRLWRDRRVNSHNTSMYYVMLTAFLKSRCVCVMSVKVLCVCLHLRARGRRSLKCSGDTLSIPEAQPPQTTLSGTQSTSVLLPNGVRKKQTKGWVGGCDSNLSAGRNDSRMQQPTGWQLNQ